MKKLILSLVAFTVTGATSSGVVSCVKVSYTQGEIGERLMMITDSGRIRDQSFNQSTYEAIIDYSNQKPYTDEEGVQHGGFDFITRDLSATRNYVEPLTSDSFSFISAYKIAAIKGTDILVLPGFQHAATVDIAAELLGPDKAIIFADSGAGTAKNITNLVYNSQLAGFAAFWDSAVWATTLTNPDDPNSRLQGDVYNHGYVSFGTFGGISDKFSVDSFIWGFLVGMRYWNMRVDAEGLTRRHIYLANAGRKGEVSQVSNITGNNANYYTGSFEPGGSIKSGTTSNLVTNQADAIFAVAGPQTADVLNTTRANVIGVDTDQSLQYPNDAHRFITSAIKNLHQSIADAIDHSKANRRNWDKEGNLLPNPVVGGEYWDAGPAPTQLNWSQDLDRSVSPNGSKFDKSILNYSDPKWTNFVNLMVDFYTNKAGESIQSYMSKEKLTEIANLINNGPEDEFKNLLPLEFEK